MRVLSCLFLLLSFGLQAQVLTVDPQGTPIRRMFRFHDLAIGTNPVEVELAHHGFQFKIKIPKEGLECGRLGDEIVRTAMLLDQLSGRSQEWEGFLANCSLVMKKDHQLLYYASSLDLTSAEILEQYLKANGVPAERIEHLKKLQAKIIAKTQHQIDWFKGFYDFLILEVKSLEASERYAYLKAADAHAESFEGVFHRTLMKSLIALRAENKPLAKKHLADLLNMHPFRMMFEVDPYLFGAKWDREMHNRLHLQVGLELTQAFKDELPVEMAMLISWLSEYNRTRLFESLRTPASRDWSLVRLREHMAKRSLALFYPSFWYHHMSYRTSTTLVQSYLDRLIDDVKDHDILKEALWIFVEDMPHKLAGRELLKNLALEIDKTDPYSYFILLELLEQPGFKRELASVRQEMGRPSFQLKREFFRGLLLEGDAMSFSLMNLLFLGDFDEDYLWGLIFATAYSQS